MNNPSSINIDPNIAYLRQREMQNHFKKINEIKSRKNKFIKSEKINWTSHSRKRSPQQFDLNQIYNINRDNKALYNKLLEISSREHKNSQSSGKTNLKNNLLNYKKNKIPNDNPILNNFSPINNLMTDEADEYDSNNINDNIITKLPKVGDTILPSIYLNNNKGFKVIQPGDTDYEPFEKISKNTNGFGMMRNEKNYNSNY